MVTLLHVALHKYLALPCEEHCSWYNFASKNYKVPVVSGGETHVSLSNFCEGLAKNTQLLAGHTQEPVFEEDVYAVEAEEQPDWVDVYAARTRDMRV